MADIYVLTGNNSNEWTLVMHFDVPDTNNAVGINHRDALVASGIGLNTETNRRTILPTGDDLGGTISTAEEALLDSGARYEHVGSFRAESGGTSNAALQASIREFYAAQNTRSQQDIGSRLRYFGHTESAS